MRVRTITAKYLRPCDTFSGADAELADYTVIKVERLIGAVSLQVMTEDGRGGFVWLRNGASVEIYR